MEYVSNPLVLCEVEIFYDCRAHDRERENFFFFGSRIGTGWARRCVLEKWKITETRRHDFLHSSFFFILSKARMKKEKNSKHTHKFNFVNFSFALYIMILSLRELFVLLPTFFFTLFFPLQLLVWDRWNALKKYIWTLLKGNDEKSHDDVLKIQNSNEKFMAT